MQLMILRRLFAVLLLLTATPVRGEDKQTIVFSGESRAASLRLAEARKRLDDHKWSEAIEELQTILNSLGNDLVSIAPNQSVRASRLCQIQLASLPADALRLYRQRHENQAQKKLQQAQAERDVLQLRKIVEDAFCTRAAEKAIDLLGDLAFERGRFDEAEEWWRLLAPLPDARREAATRGLAVVYPDPSLDPARVQAKQLLAQLFQNLAANAAGSPDADSEWTAALSAYGRQHAKAEGMLAGRKGRYVELLQALADQRKKQGRADAGDWLTFGGDSNRGRPIPAPEDILSRLSALCRDDPICFDLEQRSRQADEKPSPAVNAGQARSLAFHPVIVGNRVLVADARYVTAYDLSNGRSEEWYDLARTNGGVRSSLKLPAPPDLRYTLTVADGHAYVRLGAQDIGLEAPPPPNRFGAPSPRRDNETFLACLSLQPDDKGEHFRWHIRGIAHDNSFFEGAPLAAGGLIWIASTRYNGNRCYTAIDCYPTDDSSEPPLRWRCDVCETSEIKVGEPRYRHHLLTLAGTQIVYCTHSGVIVAVDALTGRRNWAIRYPRRTSETQEPELRDLAPVLFVGGRLYVAPADSDTLLCLDPATGRTLWELEPLRVVHLLGVGQGRLIFTTPTGLRAVWAHNGNPDWVVPDTGSLAPAGRGLLIGDLVLFPTTQVRHPGSPWIEGVVYAIHLSDGRPAGDSVKLHRLPAGNLAYANGCLAVADQQTLSVFVPQRLRLDTRKTEAPNSAIALLQLARAEADAGHNEEALRMFRRLEALLGRGPKTSTAKKLLTKSLTGKQNVLLAMAQRAADEKHWQDAENALEQAAAIPLPPRDRLHALLRAAQIWKDAKQVNRANAIWETIRADESLRAIPMIDRQGRPISLAARLTASRRPARESPALTYDSQLNAGPAWPLFRTWHVRLGHDEWILAGWDRCDPELLLTGSSDGRIDCRLTSTGEIHWTQRLPFAPCWAGCHADTILAAGAEGMVGLDREKGQLLWHFPAPVAGCYPRAPCDDVRVVLDPQPPEPLTDFRLTAGRLFFLQGQRRLFALHAETGAVLWDRWAPDGPLRLPFPHGCFASCYYAGAETVLVQMPGRRWLLDAASGRQIHESADSRDFWQRPPLELDERTLCVTPDYRHIELLNGRTGKCLSTHRPAGITTLNGELPSLLGRDSLLLCVQPANIGFFLQRIDRAGGKVVWSRLLAAKALDLGTWTFDADAVYTIEDRLLTARSLVGGEILWRRLMPADGWQVRRMGHHLAVFPQMVGAEARFRFRSLLGTVQWDLGSLLPPEAVFPLSCYDPKTGQLVQRLHFRIESPLRTSLEKRRIQGEDDRAWIVRTSSLLASKNGPVIRLNSPLPFVAIGGEVWGLTTTDVAKTELRP